MIHRATESKVHTYELTVKTGVWPGAGTTANVSFVIYGVEGNSGTLKMPETCGNDSKQNFVRWTQQKFLVILKKDIGEIYSLRVGHDNSGNAPSWHLEEMPITNPNSEAVGSLYSRHG